MVNRHWGEIEAVLDGKSYRLCLTLGTEFTGSPGQAGR
jgi:hypothetical protein